MFNLTGEKRVQPLAVSIADIPEAALLDINVVLFTPMKDPADGEDGPDSQNLHREESYYVSDLLSQTLNQSGQWGVVRVNPAREEGLTSSGPVVPSSKRKIASDAFAKQGRSVSLSGTVEDQYRQWQEFVPAGTEFDCPAMTTG